MLACTMLTDCMCPAFHVQIYYFKTELEYEDNISSQYDYPETCRNPNDTKFIYPRNFILLIIIQFYNRP